MSTFRRKKCVLLALLFAGVSLFFSSFSPLQHHSGDYLFVSVPSFAPETYEPVISNNADSVVIPLKQVGRLFLIDAKVEGQTSNLVFDTGANGLVLNSTYFRDHVRTGKVASNGITGAVGSVEQIAVDKLEFSDLTYQKLQADVTNLGHIENRRGVKILGLVGFSMMKDMEIVLDAARSELRLYKLDKTGKRTSPGSSEIKVHHTQKIEGNSNILFLKGRIAGKTLNFCFDTGAETNAISSDANKNILSTLTITRRMSLKGSGTVKSEVLFGRMNEFLIGEKQIPNMETIVTNLDALSEAYGTHIDGMLGYSFLEQGIISINFVKKQFGIRFTKGAEK